MFDSKEELLDKIGLGEDTVLELKAVRFSGDRVVGPLPAAPSDARNPDDASA